MATASLRRRVQLSRLRLGRRSEIAAALVLIALAGFFLVRALLAGAYSPEGTVKAYVGALQVALQRNGYYCGPIDGVYGPDVSDAIAKLQKNHSMRVTGTLTDPVRRALHLP